MEITSVETYKKGRYRIYIDGEPAFILYRGELRTFGIEVGQSLSPEIYNRITEEVLVKRARLRAMNLLMKHRFTEKQLRDKLSDGEYPSDIIDNAIEYVISYGYVDDVSFAEDYIFCHRENKSIARIRNDLLAKGIKRDVVEETIRRTQASQEPIDETAQINALLRKKGYNPDNTSFEEERKLYAFLCRKGFSMSAVRQCLHSLDITSEYV